MCIRDRQYDLGETVEINYKAPDGTPVQGWYILPPGFDKSKKYPLILIIHGGPHAMYRYQFNYLWHQFASDGYVVLYTIQEEALVMDLSLLTSSIMIIQVWVIYPIYYLV